MPGRKRRRANKPLRWILLCFCVFILIYVFAIPLIQFYLLEQPAVNSNRGRHYLGLFDKINLRGIEVFFASWFFFVGSAIGSFANVVVYRMPRGMSVAAKDSACPYCRQRILLRHNIPVFGWIILRGRCFVCRLPISSRYPVVEFCFGLAFLAMYFTTFLLNGNNIPNFGNQKAVRIVEMIMDPNWKLVGIYLFHCFLVSSLFVWALIRLDKMRIPVTTGVVAIVIGLVLPSIFVFLHPVNIQLFSFSAEALEWDHNWSSNLLLGGIGGLTGVTIGLITSLISKTTKRFASTGPLILGFAIVGIYLGWQATISCWLLFGCVWLAMRLLSLSSPFIDRLNPLFALLIATVINICFWSPLALLPIFAGPESSLLEIGLCLALSCVLIAATRIVDRSAPPIEQGLES